eukprot:7045858-Karenia_brevis.AAC.1
MKAPTNNSSCTHCREPISHNSWRFGRFYFLKTANKHIPAWFHVECAKSVFARSIPCTPAFVDGWNLAPGSITKPLSLALSPLPRQIVKFHPPPALAEFFLSPCDMDNPDPVRVVMRPWPVKSISRPGLLTEYINVRHVQTFAHSLPVSSAEGKLLSACLPSSDLHTGVGRHETHL